MNRMYLIIIIIIIIIIIKKKKGTVTCHQDNFDYRFRKEKEIKTPRFDGILKDYLSDARLVL